MSSNNNVEIPIKRKRGRPRKNCNDIKSKNDYDEKLKNQKTKNYYIEKKSGHIQQHSIILHIKLSKADIKSIKKKYEKIKCDNIPMPYNTGTENNLNLNSHKPEFQFSIGEKKESNTNIDTIREIEKNYSSKIEQKDKNIDKKYELNKKYYKNKEKQCSSLMLPQFFNSIEKWPQKTNIHCWWCSLPFEDIPIAIPIDYKNKTFEVVGCFCSFNCALAYNFNSKNYNKFERSSLLHLLYRKIKGSYAQIIPSESKCVLKIYGGNISIKEYKENLLTIDKTYNILFPPMKSILPELEEINIYNSQNAELKKKNKDYEINNQEKNNNLEIENLKKKNTLKLKRNKPILGNNTLEVCMGIIED